MSAESLTYNLHFHGNRHIATDVAATSRPDLGHTEGVRHICFNYMIQPSLGYDVLDSIIKLSDNSSIHHISSGGNPSSLTWLSHYTSTIIVQFKRDSGLDVGEKEPYDHRYRKDRYWKLGFYTDKTPLELKEYLAANGYQCPKNANTYRPMKAVGRYQRGLLSFEKYSTDELHGFCLARKISLPSKRMTVPRLALVLETADDNVEATCPRFMELPAELRSRIYEQHFCDYDEISTEHEQPPIAQDLPLNTNFCIDEHDFRGDSYNLTKIPAAHFAQIKNFKLHWTVVSFGARGYFRRNVNISAEISQVNNVKKIDKSFGTRVEPKSQEIKDAMQLVLHEIGHMDATWKLQRHHLIALKDAVNKVL
ncbi:hypothetical protein MBLNU13_g09004t2 [Cladosporium sp. NU13]